MSNISGTSSVSNVIFFEFFQLRRDCSKFSPVILIKLSHGIAKACTFRLMYDTCGLISSVWVISGPKVGQFEKNSYFLCFMANSIEGCIRRAGCDTPLERP